MPVRTCVRRMATSKGTLRPHDACICKHCRYTKRKGGRCGLCTHRIARAFRIVAFRRLSANFTRSFDVFGKRTSPPALFLFKVTRQRKIVEDQLSAIGKFPWRFLRMNKRFHLRPGMPRVFLSVTARYLHTVASVLLIRVTLAYPVNQLLFFHSTADHPRDGGDRSSVLWCGPGC